MIFAVEHNDTQQYRSGHNEHDWKSCVRQKRTESSNLSCCAKKNTTQQGGVLFCIQRFEQGMSEAKKRPSGAFSARCACRGVVTPRANLSCCAKAKSLGITGKASDAKAFLRFLNALLLPVTTSYNQLREHSREHSYVPRYMSCRRLTSAALSMVVLFFTQCSQRTGLFSLYSPSISPAARTALRTHCAQGQRTLPVSTPFKSLQIVAPLFS